MRKLAFSALVFLSVLGLYRLTAVRQLAVQADDEMIAPERRVNVPYTPITESNIPVPERAIFWFGQVGPVEGNYVDVRMIYNDQHLLVTLHVFDRLLWYHPAPAAYELTEWDAATLYLNLSGNSGDQPGDTAHRFVTQVSWNEPRDRFQAAYQGTGSGWTAAPTPFITSSGWQGQGFNNTVVDRGWNVTFRIPFISLGMAGPPPQGTTWGMALAVHDRDDEQGTPIPDRRWPEAVQADAPSTWGRLRFGLPGYNPPLATPGGTTTIRHGLNGMSVADGQVGGDTTCGSLASSNYWSMWGNLNYAGKSHANVQNQWNLGDWPCFSRYYTTFPLSSLPAGKSVISSTLTLFQFGNSNQDGSYPSPPQPSLIQVLTVAEDWQEATLTWNNAPLAVENVSRAWVEPLPPGPPWPNVPRQWDVSRAVAEAYAADRPLRLVLYSADSTLHSGKYFRTSEAHEVVRPVLQVAWGNAIDVGDLTERHYLPLIVK